MEGRYIKKVEGEGARPYPPPHDFRSSKKKYLKKKISQEKNISSSKA